MLMLGKTTSSVIRQFCEKKWPKQDNPLCFTAQEDGGSVSMVYHVTEPMRVSLQISTDDQKSWTEWDGHTVYLNNGEKMYVKALNDNTDGFLFNGWSNQFRIRAGKIAASGNIQYLLKSDGSRIDVPYGCYLGMFQDCISLTQAPELPATTLDNLCYAGMFNGCTSLTQAPELPATTLVKNCYVNIFKNCSSLIKAPKLPVTILAERCYTGMFENCTSLTQAPELPATTLASECYSNMFNGCTSLTQAPELPATTLSPGVYDGGCYTNMFLGCTSLTQAPELPATTLTDYCYKGMFNGCTSLTQAPELPATTLAQSCYENMFQGCSSLTQTPKLPATTLTDSCYNNMFCRSGLSELPLVQADSYPYKCMNSFVSTTQIEQFDADQYFQTYEGKSFADNCFNSMFYETPMIYAKLGNIPLIGAGMFANTQLLNVDFSGRTDQTIPRIIASGKMEVAAFDNIPAECRLIVPDNMFEAFSNDPGWGTKFAGHIVKASEA